MGLTGASGQVQRIGTPAEMVLWGWSSMLLNFWRIGTARTEDDCPFGKDLPGAATGWIDWMSLKAAADDLGNSPPTLCRPALYRQKDID